MSGYMRMIYPLLHSSYGAVMCTGSGSEESVHRSCVPSVSRCNYTGRREESRRFPCSKMFLHSLKSLHRILLRRSQSAAPFLLIIISFLLQWQHAFPVLCSGVLTSSICLSQASRTSLMGTDSPFFGEKKSVTLVTFFREKEEEGGKKKPIQAFAFPVYVRSRKSLDLKLRL